jgi:hypothetical protein
LNFDTRNPDNLAVLLEKENQLLEQNKDHHQQIIEFIGGG